MKTLTTVLLLALTSHIASAAADATLAIPGHVNSTPWVATSGSHVAVAWGATAAGKGDVYLAISSDGGRTFGRPVRVNATAGEARISGEIAPRVALSPRRGSTPIVTVTWNAKDAGTQIKTARSLDGGRTFTAPVALQAGIAGDRGWQASTIDGGGKLHAIWLDHRAMAIEKAAATKTEHKGEHDGVAMAQKSGLYYAADGVSEREVFKGVCYCCKTAMASGPKGEIYAAWRHVFAGNMRDMGFTVSRDGGKTFAPLTRVNQDGWSIQGCPDDGPAMAVDAKGTVHLIWPTVKNEMGLLLYATSKDGVTFTAPVPVPTLGSPKPSHPQIAIDGAGTVFVAWDEVRGGIRRAAVKALTGGAAPVELGDVTSYPGIAGAESGLVAAWTSGPPDRSVISVRRLR
jgi:hypothetical protein